MTRPVRTIATLVVGLAIYVALPLVAWGIGDAAGFLRDPARRGYVIAAAALCAFAAIRIPEIGKPRQPGVTRVARQRWAVLLLQILTLALMVVAPYGDRRSVAALDDAPGMRAIGVALFAAGFLVMHWAEATLGTQFSLEVEIQPNHRLITSGLYRRIRHPRYLGILMFVFGVALVFRSIAGLVLFAAIAGVLLWRIHDEEGLMRQEFGARWDDYVRRSWRIVPPLY